DVAGPRSGRLERPVAFAEADIDIVVAEADNVGAAIASDIGQEPGMLVYSPPLVNTEFRDAGGHGEQAVTAAQRDIHPIVPAADNVRPAIPDDSGQEPGGLGHAPHLVNTDSRDAGGHRERAVTIAQRDIHPIVAEADNVRPAIPGDIGQEPGVLVHAPPLVNTESRDAGGHGE